LVHKDAKVTFMLADYAQVADGKLNVIGGADRSSAPDRSRTSSRC